MARPPFPGNGRGRSRPTTRAGAAGGPPGHPRADADGYSTAVFEEGEARVEEVEDQLFRFARTVEASNSLRSTLTDAELPVSLRQEIIGDLIGERSDPATARLASYALRAGCARDLVTVLDWMVERAAAERNLRVAEVRSAVPLDDRQRQRLAEALGRVTGREVELRVTLDARLIGGIVALVGDTIIDGSVRRRLDQLRAGLELAGE